MFLASSKSLTRREALRRFGLLGGATALSSFIPHGMRAAPAASTPSLAGAQAGYYRFRIGSFEALVLHDGQLAMPTPQSPFGLDQPQSEVESTLHAAYLPTTEVKIPISVLLVRTGTDLVLVDTGCGSFFGEVGGRFAGNLAAAGIQPEHITAVVITHLHGDHFGGLLRGEGQDQVFKNARFILSRREHDFWMNNPSLASSSLPAEAQAQFIQGAQTAVNAMKGKWELIAPGDRLLEGVEFVDTPGHTPGHISVGFTSGSEQLLNLADVVHHHVISFEHPEWHMRFDTDLKLAAATRKKVLDRVATDRSRVFAGHLPFSGLGRIRATSGRFEYLVEPWQAG